MSVTLTDREFSDLWNNLAMVNVRLWNCAHMAQMIPFPWLRQKSLTQSQF